ncbi:MAG: hypothetical protein KBS38_05565 [Bacteroidales bacterium]|nr:hypothetical protein [Candidatus Cacconaster caballi]
MKKVFLFALVAFGLLAVSCKNQPKEEAVVEEAEAVEAVVDTVAAVADSTVVAE